MKQHASSGRTLSPQFIGHRKRKAILGMALFLLVLGGTWLTWRYFFTPVKPKLELTRLSIDQKPLLVLSTESPESVMHSRIDFSEAPTEKKPNFDFSFGCDGVEVHPRIVRTEGGTTYFSFQINDIKRGRMIEIPEFAYSGEDFLTVSRGRNWFLHFTRK